MQRGTKMTQEAKQLREKLEETRKELNKLEKSIEELSRYCKHKFGATTYDPIITPAYHLSGDPPGTMGVDWQGPMDVPEHVEKRWSRVCEYCGEIEYTTNTKQKIEYLPDWGQK